MGITSFLLSSARAIVPAGSHSTKSMNGFSKFCVLALFASGASAGGPQRRGGKNLRGTFPFNQANGRQAHQHQAHGDHAAHAVESVPACDARQRGRGGDDVALDIGSIAAAGERCIDKVVMVEETEYDDVIECKHSYSQKCHTTYTTDFEPQQEEKCEENFIKSCFIEYKTIASDEKVQFCNTPLVCECEDVTQGYTTEKKCTKWPKQVCNTQRKRVKKYSPETECKKVPRELCGPSGCELKPGPEECFDRTETVAQEVPEETCNLEPQKECKHVTKLVPLLKPAEECVDIPKEVCSRSRTNPRKVQKPVVKKWCYVPTAESGLA